VTTIRFVSASGGVPLSGAGALADAACEGDGRCGRIIRGQTGNIAEGEIGEGEIGIKAILGLVENVRDVGVLRLFRRRIIGLGYPELGGLKTAIYCGAAAMSLGVAAWPVVEFDPKAVPVPSLVPGS